MQVAAELSNMRFYEHFLVIFALFTLVNIAAYLVYGNSLRASMIDSVQTIWMQTVVNLLIAGHCLFVVMLILSPVTQTIESWLHTPQTFGVARVVIRTAVMALVLLVAETLPDFGPIIALLGATMVTLTCLAFPSLFYLSLRAQERKCRL